MVRIECIVSSILVLFWTGVSSTHCQVFKSGMWKLKKNLCFYGEADLKLQAWCVVSAPMPVLLNGMLTVAQVRKVCTSGAPRTVDYN